MVKTIAKETGIVILLLIFGYGTLFGFKDIKLLGSASKRTNNKENVLVDEIKPIIQNVVIKEKTAYLQAGAGLVYDSVPEKEFEEIQNKLMALKEALR